MSSDVVISVKNISKCFEMYEKPSYRLLQTLCAGKKKFYKEFWALRDINFELRRGECLGIVGRNGAGKSTLLQIITGTLLPTEGEVVIKGRVAALLELGSGFNPEFTGRENVYLNAAILGLTRVETEERLQAILDFAEIGEFIDQPVKSYSSGMMMRLAFSVIAHVDADVLIVDEALSVGDAFFVQKCMRFMRKFMEENTVLFVSHDTGAVVNLCDRAVLLNGGKVKSIGAPKDIADEYLKEMYAGNQDVAAVDEKKKKIVEENEDLFFRDMRADLLNHSNLRNDLEFFEFKPDDSFGDGGATVKRVFFSDMKDQPLQWIVGGEMVKLRVDCVSHREQISPIVGFILRDHLGQNLFGDNTFVTYMEHPLHLYADQRYSATFTFRMPYLAPGDYSITVAIAEGSNEKHIQHQWINEALIFKSHSQSPASHLIGIPMRDIELTAEG